MLLLTLFLTTVVSKLRKYSLLLNMFTLIEVHYDGNYMPNSHLYVSKYDTYEKAFNYMNERAQFYYNKCVNNGAIPHTDENFSDAYGADETIEMIIKPKMCEVINNQADNSNSWNKFEWRIVD